MVERMTCPNCNQLFNIDDKNSGYQVNDLTELTYCSWECSAQHLFKPEAMAHILKHVGPDDSKEEIIECINAEIDSSISQEQITDLAEKIIAEAQKAA